MCARVQRSVSGETGRRVDALRAAAEQRRKGQEDNRLMHVKAREQAQQVVTLERDLRRNAEEGQKLHMLGVALIRLSRSARVHGASTPYVPLQISHKGVHLGKLPKKSTKIKNLLTFILPSFHIFFNFYLFLFPVY